MLTSVADEVAGHADVVNTSAPQARESSWHPIGRAGAVRNNAQLYESHREPDRRVRGVLGLRANPLQVISHHLICRTCNMDQP